MYDLFLLICLLFSLKYGASAEDCYKEDFGSGSLGIVNKACVGASLFSVEKYDEHAEGLPKPSGANDFFITPGAAGLSCIESKDDFKVVAGTMLELSLFTKNPGGTLFAFWLLIDSATGDQLNIKPIFIDDGKIWKTSVIKVTKSSRVRIKLQSDELKSKNAFLAIDYLKIKVPNAEDCNIKPTTTTTTADYTETTAPNYYHSVENCTPTTTDYTENTTPATVDYREITTPNAVDYIENTTPNKVDYTESTTPTAGDYQRIEIYGDYAETETTTPTPPPEVTPEPSATVTPEPPPSSVTCNCNCNCNFQCIDNPFTINI